MLAAFHEGDTHFSKPHEVRVPMDIGEIVFLGFNDDLKLQETIRSVRQVHPEAELNQDQQPQADLDPPPLQQAA